MRCVGATLVLLALPPLCSALLVSRVPGSLLVSPHIHRASRISCSDKEDQPSVQSQDERLAVIEAALRSLQAAGVSGESVSALESELSDLQAAIRLRDSGSEDTAEPLVPFPSPETIGVQGQRSLVVFFACDGIPKAETLLETVEDEAAEYASCGCALVAVRQFDPSVPNDVRKAEAYAERFPSFNFVDGLEKLDAQRSAVGVEGAWFPDAERSLYNEPVVCLLEPDGGIRAVLSHSGLSPFSVNGNMLRQLHLAVPREEARISRAEAEAAMQALYKDNADWAEVLREDESLRQPTRTWFDGLFVGRDQKPLLAGVENDALPEAIDRYLEGEGEEAGEEEELPELTSQDGTVKAPKWYVQAKTRAEKKQAEERERWNGTAPSGTAGPLPLGPSGRRLEPAQEALTQASQRTRKALQQSSERNKKMIRGFFQSFGGAAYDEDNERRLEGAASEEVADASEGRGGADGKGAGGDGMDEAARIARGEPMPRSPATESALLRAEMLALGLSRSSTSAQSTRRLRLLQELVSAVRELEDEGFRDMAALGKLKEQIKTSYASAPPEFIAEARRADLFNEYAPPMDLVEIAAELAELAKSRAETVGKGIDQIVTGADWDSLNPSRKRGPRPKGNKIDISKRQTSGPSDTPPPSDTRSGLDPEAEREA
jgi:hypothetical protein